MIVEGLGSVTFVNGILRVQTTSINAEGRSQESGNIEIPGGLVGDVIQALAKATQGISEKINETNVSQTEESKDDKDNKKKTGKSKSKN